MLAPRNNNHTNFVIRILIGDKNRQKPARALNDNKIAKNDWEIVFETVLDGYPRKTIENNEFPFENEL